MMPKNPVLRYAFRAAAAKLRTNKKKVTAGALADELGTKSKSVQRFLYRDLELANELEVELEHAVHGVGQYAEAIVNIPTKTHPTTSRIAEILGLDHSSVSKFLKDHPELRALHPRFTPPLRRKKVKVVERKGEEVHVQPQSPRWRDLGVAVWHEGVGRFVGTCATRREYLDYWKRGLLKHQQEKKPKPEYLPTPEEVANMT